METNVKQSTNPQVDYQHYNLTQFLTSVVDTGNTCANVNWTASLTVLVQVIKPIIDSISKLVEHTFFLGHRCTEKRKCREVTLGRTVGSENPNEEKCS